MRLTAPSIPLSALPETSTTLTGLPGQSRTPPAKWAGVLLLCVVLVCAGGGFFHLTHRGNGDPSQGPQEAQVRSLFSTAVIPCRRGDQAVCVASMDKIRSLDDQPDASVLLADLKVARYLHTLSDGDRLSARWQQDQITPPELTAMGNAAYLKGLSVYRSLWISADLKREGTAVPELIFGGAKFPNTP